MKGENMRYLIVIILFVATIVVAGCVSGNNNTVVTPTQAPVPSTISSTTSLTMTEKQAMIERLIAEKPAIPPNVVYKKAGSEVNRNALDKLSGFFLATDRTATTDTLFSDTLICGPGLWQTIKDDDEMKRITTGVTQIKVPTHGGVQTLEGKTFQGKEEVESFQRALLRHYTFGSPTVIRRPTARELSTYWAMIPYDIEEPIFIVESKEATILVDFDAKEDTRIFWIDDYQHIL
jgi:hypothetical protein